MQVETGIAPAQAEGDFVIRQGKYFEIGEYPDKAFSLTEAEADAVLADFVGAPLNVEHMPTLFDGKLGTVRRLWRTGRDILAEYVIPRWLHEVTGGEPLTMSSEWDRATKRPLGAAFVLSPRVRDAVMMAAFRKAAEEEMGPLAGNAALFPTGPTGRPVSGEERLEMGSGERILCTGKETEGMSLLGRFAAFLRGEGLIEATDVAPFVAECSQSVGSEATSLTLMGSPGSGPDRGNGESVIALSTRADIASSEEGAAEVTRTIDFTATPEYRQMSAAIREQEATIAQLQAQFTVEREQATFASNTAEITRLVRLGRMTAGEGEQWRLVAQEHPVAFAAVLPTLQARPALPPFADRMLRRLTPDPEEAAGRLTALTKERAKRTGERYEAAFSAVCRENPELAAEHAAGAPSYGGSAHE